LVGMGTAFAGIVRTPLTSVIMIFEVTRDYTIIVPLMIANLIAFFISHRLQRQPIYEALARQDGIHLPGGEGRTAPARMRVTVAMRQAPETWSPRTRIGDVVQSSRDGALDAWPVADGDGFYGMVDRVSLERAVAAGRSDQPLVTLLPSRHTDTSGWPHVHPDQSLTVALDHMGTMQCNVLPVVSRANIHQLLGIVTLQDILATYGVPTGMPTDGNDASG
jgi:chloride channel protein, CIC family